jgi:hypothetical protein
VEQVAPLPRREGEGVRGDERPVLASRFSSVGIVWVSNLWILHIHRSIYAQRLLMSVAVFIFVVIFFSSSSTSLPEVACY